MRIVPMREIRTIRSPGGHAGWPVPQGVSPMFDRWVKATAASAGLDENVVRRGRAAKEYARQLGIWRETE